MLILTTSLILIPHTRSLVQLGIAQVIMGFMNGASNSASQAFLLDIWAPKSSPFLNAYHLFFASGSILGPLICNPFLLQEKSTEMTTIATTTFTSNFSDHLFTITEESFSTDKSSEKSESHIAIPFAIGSFFSLLSAVFSFVSVFYFYFKSKPRNNNFLTKSKNTDIVESEKTNEKKNLTKLQVSVIVLLTSLILSLQLGVEVEISQYIPTFVADLGK